MLVVMACGGTGMPVSGDPAPHGPGDTQADERAALVLAAEQQRIEIIERVAPSVVCVYDAHRRGGGSGVLIDPEGYGLTNYHVVAGLLGARKGWGGLGDGVIYELEVLGIDVTGDVAMFRLIPTKPGHKFPSAPLGDSDRVRVGDTAMAMGNPFMISRDSTPSVTLGMVTGVHRYQQGVGGGGGNLVYTDCIQVDAPINPGNSGGPLFNAAGEVIGINGRISVNTRGRFNVGFGYAISSNQIKRFMPAMRAGLLARHGTWQARVEDRLDAGGLRVEFAEVRESGPAYAAGIRVGDTLLSLDGVRVTSANQVASMLGTYPAGWPVWLRAEPGGRSGESPRDLIVRLDAIRPRMRKPFEADRAINQREVRRVLHAFRRAVLGDENASCPDRRRWTVVRVDVPDADSGGPNVGLTARFEVTHTAGEPVRMEEIRGTDERGSAARVIEYDAHSARQRSSEDHDWHEPGLDTVMVLGARYVMLDRLLEPADALRPTEVAHVGADALLPTDLLASSVPVANESDRLEPRLLELIEWPIADRAVARFAFDSESHLVVRIDVREPVLGASATITLSDYRDIGGLIWPCTVEVRGSGYHYRDLLTDWEVRP